MENILNEKDFCCFPLYTSTTLNTADAGKNIVYTPYTRTYAMVSIGDWYMSVITYCPYCGKKLPVDLYEKRLEIIEKEFPEFSENEIPEEFKTDEWWRKRGL